MNLWNLARNYYRRTSFKPDRFSILLSPVYIIRRGLFIAIREFAPMIGGDVLDLGCGSKPYKSLFTSASTYVGVDMESTGHDHRDSNIDVFYDGHALPFPNGRFDCVVSFEVFEHIFNLPTIVAEIGRVTRSGGMLLISIPFAWPEHEVPYDFARYTSFGIRAILREGGYEVLQLRKTTSHIMAAFQILIAYLSPDTCKRRYVRYLRQVLVVFPITLTACVVDFIFPKRYNYYSNAVILARKVEADGAMTSA